jgi:hypothetical protein
LRAARWIVILEPMSPHRRTRRITGAVHLALLAVVGLFWACASANEPGAGDSAPADTSAARDAGASDGRDLDGAALDANAFDSAARDGAPSDVEASDTGPLEAGVSDASVVDEGVADAVIADASVDDGGVADTGVADTGVADTGVADTGVADTGVADTGVADTGALDGGGAGDSGGFAGYSTNFAGSENPISEAGAWTNGGAVGLDWQNIAKNNGLAYASNFSSGYNDCIAHLSGFNPNQYAEATVHLASGYRPATSHEVELLLRFAITAHNARGYEINWSWDGSYAQIVRWNGPLNDFTYLSSGTFGALVEGDVIRATAVGSTITLYKNGVPVLQAVDSTWPDGNPGMGMFARPDPSIVLESYGFSAFSAG